MEKKVFENQLERFRHIQGTLSHIYPFSDEYDMSEAACDLVELNTDTAVFAIKTIPLKGDDVIVHMVLGEKEGDFKFPLSTFSADIIGKVLNIMHRALIIEEIRNHIEY